MPDASENTAMPDADELAQALDATAHGAASRVASLRNAAGASSFAFLMLLVLTIAFYALDRASPGDVPYAARLEGMVRAQADRDFSAVGVRDVVEMPHWPLRLYERLRADAALFSLMVVLMAWLLVRRENARAAWLIAAQRHVLEQEITALRLRLDALDKSSGASE